MGMFVYLGDTPKERDDREAFARQIVKKYEVSKNVQQRVGTPSGMMQVVRRDIKREKKSFNVIESNGVRMEIKIMKKEFASLQYNGDVIISTHSVVSNHYRTVVGKLSAEKKKKLNPKQMATLLLELMKNRIKPKNIVILGCNAGARLSSPEKVVLDFDGKQN